VAGILRGSQNPRAAVIEPQVECCSSAVFFRPTSRKVRGRGCAGARRRGGSSRWKEAEAAALAALPPTAAADQAAWGDRYFERQDPKRDMRGRHVADNLFGGPQYIDGDLERACLEVVNETGEKIGTHQRPNEWYSHSVLAKAFDLTARPVCRMLSALVILYQYSDLLDCEDVLGAIVNVNNVHWAAIVNHNGITWNADSCYCPVTIDQKISPEFCPCTR
jgi:hypothetical protein